MEADFGDSADKFPSSWAFDTISSALQGEQERKDAIKQGKAIFGFTLKNPEGETASWHIDLKNTGTVGKGLSDKPTGEFSSYSFSLSFETCRLVRPFRVMFTLVDVMTSEWTHFEQGYHLRFQSGLRLTRRLQLPSSSPITTSVSLLLERQTLRRCS